MGRVKVYGSGTAGLFAAYTAASLGAEVEVFTHSGGSSLFFTGAMLPPASNPRNLWPSWLQKEMSSNFMDALELLGQTGLRYAGDPEKAETYLKSDGGTLLAYFVLESMRGANLEHISSVRAVMVKFQNEPFVKAPSLNADIRVLHINSNVHPMKIARDVEEKGVEVLSSLIPLNEVDNCDVILIEPCAGLRSTSQVMQALREKLGKEVWEVPSPGSNVPGQRVLEHLKQAFDNLPVTFKEGNFLTEIPEGNGASVVLATGFAWLFDTKSNAFAITLEGPVREILSPDAFHQRTLFNDSPWAQHEAYSVHVLIDEKMRLLSLEREPLHQGRLFACGSLVTGLEGGMAATLVSAYIAGREAARTSL